MNTTEPSQATTATKEEIAVHQLDRAIRSLLDEQDVISAVTLAGAAEEILGKLVEKQGGTPSLKAFVALCLSPGIMPTGPDSTAKDIVSIANYYRNEFKHYSEGSEVQFTTEAAHEIIGRAASNLYQLNGRRTEQVVRYLLSTYCRPR